MLCCLLNEKFLVLIQNIRKLSLKRDISASAYFQSNAKYSVIYRPILKSNIPLERGKNMLYFSGARIFLRLTQNLKTDLGQNFEKKKK